MVKLVVASLLFVSLPLFAEDFYEQQLRAGKADLAADRTVQAADELRVAAFGFLDRPPLLIEALVRLALAQNALSQSGPLARTVGRFVEIERRFASYASAPLDAPTRTAFETLLLKNESRTELTSISSLSRLLRSDAAKVSDLPPEKREAAYEAGFRSAPADIEWPLAAARDSAARGLDSETIKWARRALDIDRHNPGAQSILAHALARRGDCRDALSLLSAIPAAERDRQPETEGDRLVCLVAQSQWREAQAVAPKLSESQRSRTDVARALQAIKARRDPAFEASTSTTAAQESRAKVVQAVAVAKALIRSGRYSDAERILGRAIASEPGNRELRLSLLEASVLSRDWHTAVGQLPTVLPFKDGEESSMFYASAALYENGRTQEARPYLERARPHLTSNPLVDYYARLILGESPK